MAGAVWIFEYEIFFFFFFFFFFSFSFLFFIYLFFFVVISPYFSLFISSSFSSSFSSFDWVLPSFHEGYAFLSSLFYCSFIAILLKVFFTNCFYSLFNSTMTCP